MQIEILNDEDITSLTGNGKYIYVTTSNGKIMFKKKEASLRSDSWQNCLEMVSEDMSFIDSTAKYHIGLTKSGKVFKWNDHDQDPCQNGHASPSLPMPKMLSINNYRVVQVSCGMNHTVCLTKEGIVGGWGSNTDGQLGLGRNASPEYLEPQFIDCLKGVPFIQVAAGGYHTLALTGSSAVFGWGRNSSGQLGLEKKDKQLVPAPCQRIRAKMIRFVSCGEHHTAMLSKNGRLFSFGLDSKELSNDEGVGILDGEVCNLKGQQVSSIVCGSRNTIAFVRESGKIFIYGHGQAEIDLVEFISQSDCAINDTNSLPSRTIALFSSSGSVFVHIAQTQDADFECETMSKLLTFDKAHIFSTQEVCGESLKEKLKRTLSSASCLNGCFLCSDFLHQECSRMEGHRVDMEMVRKFFDMLKKKCSDNISISATVVRALQSLVSQLPKDPAHVEALRLYLFLPFCHLMEDIKMGGTIIDPFINSLKILNKTCQKIFDVWLKNIPCDLFKRYLSVFKHYISELLLKFKNKSGEAMATVLQSSLWLMKKLYKVNQKRREKAMYEDFYVSELLSTLDIREDFISSLRDVEQRRQHCRFCEFPFLYNQEAKGVLLKGHCRIAMVDADISLVSNMPQVFGWDLSQYIAIKTVDEKLQYEMNKQKLPFIPDLIISRLSIIEDTKQLLRDRDQNMHERELRVQFKEENAVGQGVYQEYFTVLFNKLLDPNFGLFSVEEESNLIWFKPQTEDKLDELHFVGFMLGLALYNSKLINLQFPLALYKKLLSEPVTFEDFEEFKPHVAAYLIKYIPDKEKEEIELVFTESITRDGTTVFVELCEDGQGRTVTNDNKEEYIDLKVDFQFNKRVEKEFESFRQGFCKAFNIDVLRKLKFQPTELRAVINGEENIDVDALRQTATYGDCYHAEHSVICDLWKWLATDTTEDEKKWFIRFITGTDRISHGGTHLRIERLVKDGEDTDDLMPVVATCSNVLFLPCYSKAAKLKERFLKAIKPKDNNVRNFTSLSDALGSQTDS